MYFSSVSSFPPRKYSPLQTVVEILPSNSPPPTLKDISLTRLPFCSISPLVEEGGGGGGGGGGRRDGEEEEKGKK